MSAATTVIDADFTRFERAFAQALRRPSTPPFDAPTPATTATSAPSADPASATADAPVAALVRDLAAQPGFAVYRNTVAKGCIDALAANFPTVRRLSGEAWFRSAAARFVDAHWPVDANLSRYGQGSRHDGLDDGFAAFLAALPSIEEWPWIADVARADAAWLEAHQAADAPALSAAEVASWSPARLAGEEVRVHPATRRVPSAHPLASIWLRERAALLPGAAARYGGPAPAITWQAEPLLLTRPDDRVLTRPLSSAEACFLDGCDAGHPLGTVAVEVARAFDAQAVTTAFAGLLEAGALVAPPHASPERAPAGAHAGRPP